MAALPVSSVTPVDEYLNSSYSPDREYVDGELVGRDTPTISHGLLQVILIEYFRAHRKQFGFAALSEVRTRIIERARYRIPDIMLCPVPLPAGNIMTAVPWAVIEILSPDDKMSEQLRRFWDYSQIGVLHIVLLDPEELVAHRFEDDSLIKTAFTHLELPSGRLPFDSEALFRQLQVERAEGQPAGAHATIK